MTPRDKVALGWMAVCGVLSREQMQQLPGFDGKLPSILGRRLKKLSSGRKPSRAVERMDEDKRHTSSRQAWRLTLEGFELVLDLFKQEPKPTFLQAPPVPSAVQNYLVVAGLPFRLGLGLRAEDPFDLPFVWNYAPEFPAGGFEEAAARAFPRTVKADGVLTLPAARRAYIVNGEAGSYPVEFGEPRSTAALLRRVEWYRDVLTDRHGRVNRLATRDLFPGEWPFEVLFPCSNRTRADQMAKEVAKAFPDLPFPVRATTYEAEVESIAKVIRDTQPDAQSPGAEDGGRVSTQPSSAWPPIRIGGSSHFPDFLLGPDGKLAEGPEVHLATGGVWRLLSYLTESLEVVGAIQRQVSKGPWLDGSKLRLPDHLEVVEQIRAELNVALNATTGRGRANRP
jgi:hypothetical protein